MGTCATRLTNELAKLTNSQLINITHTWESDDMPRAESWQYRLGCIQYSTQSPQIVLLNVV
jgi:hypothetical protein